MTKKKSFNQIKLENLKIQIEKDAHNNPLLKNHHLLDDYFLSFREDFKLVGIIPSLQIDFIYSNITTKLKNTEDYVVPAHLYINPDVSEIMPDSFQQKNIFLFNSELDKLFSYEKRVHYPTYGYNKKENTQALEQFIIDHPVVVIFMGNDDTHYGVRFKTELEAMTVLNSLEDFSDINGFHVEFFN